MGMRISAVADSHDHIHRDPDNGDQAGNRMRSARSGYGEAAVAVDRRRYGTILWNTFELSY
jgi:hypothetical protein